MSRDNNTQQPLYNGQFPLYIDNVIFGCRALGAQCLSRFLASSSGTPAVLNALYTSEIIVVISSLPVNPAVDIYAFLKGEPLNAPSGKTGHSFNIAIPPSWIPACAGMTTETKTGLSPYRQTYAWQYSNRSPYRHSGAGPPAWMQVVEPRLERRPRNPVVYFIHSRPAGMTTHGLSLQVSPALSV